MNNIKITIAKLLVAAYIISALLSAYTIITFFNYLLPVIALYFISHYLLALIPIFIFIVLQILIFKTNTNKPNG